MKELKYNVYVESEKPEALAFNDIVISSRRELEILRLCLRDKVNFVPKNPKYNTTFKISAEADAASLDWDYRKPQEAHAIIEKIKMPTEIEKTLASRTETISKEYVHKVNVGNVLISVPERFENVLFFRGYNYTDEIKSDHNADHLDGIKLFEVARQATLASFHTMGVTFEGVMALTTSCVDFKKYIELDRPYYVQIIPACKTDGGCMYSAFAMIQDNQVNTSGFIGAYTFRNRELYLNKRMQNKGA
ncbi:MAG: AfsA-related hotdog domain-containing protein [Anaerocolumna sp.]